MKSKSRRYEVLLPVRFNDGNDIPEELLAEAVNEIVEQFNAVTFHRETVEGRWRAMTGSSQWRNIGNRLKTIPIAKRDGTWTCSYWTPTASTAHP